MNQLSVNLKTTSLFESIRKFDDQGREYWLARELMPLLGYGQWKNFDKVIKRAMDALSKSYPHTGDHFVEIGKKIKIGVGSNKEATREIVDYKLTRHACYLIAQNGDSKKQEIALAQVYFATQTRRQEMAQEKQKAIARVVARRKLSTTEKKFSGILSSRNIDGASIAEIKSAGDEALFGSPTKEVKAQMGISDESPLADHLPTISIKAKDLATEMTTFNTLENGLIGKDRIKSEHINNNSAVRKMLNENGIYPERLPAEEDVKKLERKIKEQDLALQSSAKKLAMDLDKITLDIRGVKSRAELERIRDIIKGNPGAAKMFIVYGAEGNIRVLEREIGINSNVIAQLRQYIIDN